ARPPGPCVEVAYPPGPCPGAACPGADCADGASRRVGCAGAVGPGAGCKESRCGVDSGAQCVVVGCAGVECHDVGCAVVRDVAAGADNVPGVKESIGTVSDGSGADFGAVVAARDEPAFAGDAALDVPSRGHMGFDGAGGAGTGAAE